MVLEEKEDQSDLNPILDSIRFLTKRPSPLKGFLRGFNHFSHAFKLTNNINYQIRTVSVTNSIYKTSDAYFEFRNNWAEGKINSEKGYKALALNDSNKFICEISFESKRKISKDDARKILELLEKHNAAKVFLGFNKPLEKKFLPSETEMRLARQFKSIGEKLKVSVIDQLILNDCESYSFEDNGL